MLRGNHPPVLLTFGQSIGPARDKIGTSEGNSRIAKNFYDVSLVEKVFFSQPLTKPF